MYLGQQLFLEQAPSIFIVQWFDMVRVVGGSHVLDKVCVPSGDDDSAPGLSTSGLEDGAPEDITPRPVGPDIIQQQQKPAR